MHSKPITLLILLTSMLLLTSCETEIPEVDVTDPTFAFHIQGPGINKTYTQDTDFSIFQLNLKSNANYTFSFFGSDDGGVKTIQWQAEVLMPSDFSDVVPEDVVITDLQLSTLLSLNGDQNEPVSSLGMAGDFETNNGNYSAVWLFYVSDYGGQGGTPNDIYREMFIFVTNAGPFGEQSL